MPSKNSPVPTASPVPPRPRRLTLLDIARAVGVSKTSVSNAFNRPHQLSQALREVIISKARELGYFGPDPAARALRSTTIHEVAVIFHHDLGGAFDDPAKLAFLRGVTKELDIRKLSLQLIPRLGRDPLLGAAFQTTASALIILAEIPHDVAPEIRAARKPLVLVDATFPGVTSIATEERIGAELAMAHALSRNPDVVLVATHPLAPEERSEALGDPQPARRLSVTGERLAGYAAAVRKARFPAGRIHWLEIDETAPASITERVASVREQMQDGARLAIVAMNDTLALSVRAITSGWDEVGVVAIVGFGDIPAAATTGLSTIRHDAFRKGELAVQALLDGATPDPIPMQLITRDT